VSHPPKPTSMSICSHLNPCQLTKKRHSLPQIKNIAVLQGQIFLHRNLLQNIIFQGWVIISGFSRGKENPGFSGSLRVSRVCWPPCHANCSYPKGLDWLSMGVIIPYNYSCKGPANYAAKDSHVK